MKKGHNTRKRKKNNHYLRLLIICLEVLGLVLAIGLGFVFFKVDERSRITKNLERAGITAKLLEGTNVSDAAKNHNNGSSGRYGELLENDALCKEDKIYAKDTISSDEVVLDFAGDISFAEGYANMNLLEGMGGNIRECFDEPILTIMENADIFMLNNEFPYTDRGTPTQGKTYTFRSKPENVKYLYDLGVDVVSVANNHVYDYGQPSILDTITTLEDAALPYAGAGETIEQAIKPVYFIANDTKIAYICATQIERLDYPDTVGATSTSPGVFRCWNNNRILEVIKEAKQNSDYVITYIHWGTEMQVEPDWAQLQQAKEIQEAGADLIIGDHPHCLQQISYIGNTPIIYSLGNFWFNSRTQDTGILEVKISTPTQKKNKDQNDVDNMKVTTKSVRFIPAIQSGCKTKLLQSEEKIRVLNYMQSISPDVILDEDGYVTPK